MDGQTARKTTTVWRQGEERTAREREELMPGQGFPDNVQLRLMARIHELGSIAMAARSLGISYRAAWDMVLAINRLSTTPLIYRTGLGSTVGVTRLSEEGRGILSRLTGAGGCDAM